jgi:hypothetical protein
MGAEISRQSLDVLLENIFQLLNDYTEHYLRLYRFSLPVGFSLYKNKAKGNHCLTVK